MQSIIAIHPKWVNLIKENKKKYELRKTFPKQIKKIWIYETSPTKKIIGCFDVGKIIENTPYEIFKLGQKALGTNEKEFFDYYKNKKKAIAIEIVNFRSVDPIDFNWSKVYPRSYKIIESITDI